MNRKSFCVKNGKRYKLVPPDGGWGHLICAAVSLNMFEGGIIARAMTLYRGRKKNFPPRYEAEENVVLSSPLSGTEKEITIKV
ncbi:hypothetical protein EVAR_45617_1 [Eumeta japonica]|uniref:Uncharacterized protein n=1 Tax=Eumeta variegata TaxID=151549 RepID=A0A4C1WEN8_EUMVA|nr:hypothetical protein EVAR_45617_1 [Eumeta japonica]